MRTLKKPRVERSIWQEHRPPASSTPLTAAPSPAHQPCEAPSWNRSFRPRSSPRMTAAPHNLFGHHFRDPLPRTTQLSAPS